MSGPQFIPLYVGDYLRDTAHLTTEQHGIYLLLLMACWTYGRLPNNPRQLAAIARLPSKKSSKCMEIVDQFLFLSDDGFYHQKRIDKERQHIVNIHNARSKAGSNGAAKRWRGDDFANGKSMLATSTSTSTVSKDTAPPTAERAPEGRAAAPDEDLEEEGAALLGERKRGLIRKMRVKHGAETVRAALAAVVRRQPAEPIPYFLSCCEEHKPGPDPPAAQRDPGPQGPPPKFFNPEDDRDAEVEGLRH